MQVAASEAASSAPNSAPNSAPKGKKRAPRGLLKQKVHTILKAAAKPMKPSEIRDAVMKAGYPNNNPGTLYTSVFVALGKDKAVKKTKDGYVLRAGATPASAPEKKAG